MFANQWKHLAALVLLAALPAAHALAQTWPADKPIRIIVPYPPGGSSDAISRLVALHLGKRLDRPVVIENIAGASGNIGTERVVRSAPDGHTIVLAATPLSTNPSFYNNIPFDVLTDLKPITMITRQAFVLVVHPTISAKTVPELIALAKSKPGALTFASHSAGGATHLAGELFKVLAGIDMLHVPYKGQAPAALDMLAGRVSMLFDSASTAMPQVSQGRLRALATTGPSRSLLVANGALPTMSEFKGLEDFNVTAWFGYMGPANLPQPIAERLANEINAVIQMPEVTAKLNEMGFEAVGSSPTDFSAHVKREVAKWAKIVKATGAKLE